MRRIGWTLFLIGAGWFFGSRAGLLVLDALELTSSRVRGPAEGVLEIVILGLWISWIPMLGGLLCILVDAVERELRKGSNRRRRLSQGRAR